MAERRKKRGPPLLHAQQNFGEKHLQTLRSLVDPEIDKEIQRIQDKEIKTVQDIVLLCLLRFRQIAFVMRVIPKSSGDWENVQLQMVKRLIPIKYLSDKDIRKIIAHVRKINAERYADKPLVDDPDLPACYYWNLEQVGEWLTSIGCYHLKEMFARNCISGRKLITVDASALNKMGIRYFTDIQVLTSEIRNILKIHRPNMMRALMRKVPFEHYLQENQWTGESYQSLTFEKFCKENGYPYRALQENPLGLIECTCELAIYLSAFAEINDNDGGASSGHNSLVLAPTVEFNVRHILIRDKVVSELINELLEMGFNSKPKDGNKEPSQLKSIFEQGFEDLGLSQEDLAKRLEFGRLIAEEMLNEAKRTEATLQDIAKFRKFLKDENISEETVERMQVVASDFFNSVANVGALLAFGELDLDTIFRQTPEFNVFVDGIIGEAETKVNKMEQDLGELNKKAQ